MPSSPAPSGAGPAAAPGVHAPQRRSLQLPLLALDTATEQIAAGLHTGAGSFVCLAPGGAAASSQLLPRLRGLLDEAGLGWADLGGIAFGRGPGAFTGLRTACAVAQGLALGLDRPLLPLDSLLIVAEDARVQAGRAALAGFEVAVAMDARMDEVYAGRYRWDGQAWQVLQAPALLDVPALAAAWASLPPPHVAGSALQAFGDRLALPAAGTAWSTEVDRASALLRLALQAMGQEGGVDAAEALPLYLRDKVAQTTAEREAARAALTPVAHAPAA